jgi:hypothetical protein
MRYAMTLGRGAELGGGVYDTALATGPELVMATMVTVEVTTKAMIIIIC